MDLIELRAGQVHLSAEPDDLIALNNSLSWIVHGLDPIGNDDLQARTGMSIEAASELLERVPRIRPAETARAELWFSVEELRWLERMVTGVLEGWIDILRDWELIGVCEGRYEAVQRGLRRVLDSSSSA